MDSSLLGNLGSTRFSGLVCDEFGIWILGFAGSIPWADNLCMELLALRRGLQLAWQHGYRRVICEANCSEVFSLFWTTVFPFIGMQQSSMIFTSC